MKRQVLTVSLLFVVFFAIATEPKDAAPEPTPTKAAEAEADAALIISERVQVIGSKEVALKTPGSAHHIGKAELEKQAHTDIHRILREVPGVNIQEEDGLGLRPNIGIRGTGVERSSKITLLEDGVLIAPAPYTAPSAYYFPTAGRMEGVEVLKGSGAVSQGPYTNGGALNMISAAIPSQDLAVDLRASAGSFGTNDMEVKAGGSGDRFGWLLQGFRTETDGFKDLDGGRDTPTEVDDFMLKLRYTSAPGASVYQALELKLGKTEQSGDETYLGLTQADFNATPYRRYAASAEDHIDTDHEQVQLQYFVKPSDNLDITTTVYNNDFFRNWHKLEKVAGQKAANVLNDPGTYATEIAILRGELDSADDALAVRNNRRNYYSRGIQSALNWTGGNHRIEVGARYHEDEEDRFQDEEYFRMIDAQMELTSVGAPGSQTNRVSSAEALAFYLEDTITTGNWSIRPGVRYETIDYVRNDYSTADPTRGEGPTRVRENSVDVFLPGIGVNYELAQGRTAFLGIHRGFSPPGPGKDDRTESEESTNYEMGYRFNQGSLSFEAIGFYNDYDNLLGTETVAGGGDTSGDVFNGGEVEINGLELNLNYDLAEKAGLDMALPFHANYTYTSTEFKNSFETSFSDWSPEVTAGDELPYIPEHQLTLNFGLVKDRWSAYLVGNYTDEMRTKAGQGAIPEDEGTDSRFVVDLSAGYTFGGNYKVFARVRNLTDETYIVARRPYGLRPGLKRTLSLGISANF
ncbi:MAG: TonB-dependent receptor [Acidobacteriota bacterium]|nr:TonB-dependent receptor [Acidobacteriota bacterium]